MNKLLSALIPLTVVTVIAQSKPIKPNILFLFADDLTIDAIGDWDNQEVLTPNLDKLMKRGVTFTHAFNMGAWNGAVCLASRSMIFSGRSVWDAGRLQHVGLSKSSKYKSIRKLDTYWPQYLSQAGYETYFSGKYHVERYISAKNAFDHSRHVRPGMPKQSKARYDRKMVQELPDTWDPSDKKYGGYWQGGKHWSEVLADDAIDYISMAKKSHKPFFMYLAFNAPHDPRQAPKSFIDLYPLKNISVPKSFLPKYPYCKAAGSGPNLRDEKLAPFPRTKYAVKKNRQEYYALITHMDAQIGKILKALKDSGKEDNTYIFFTADHGLAVGDHGFIGKQNSYDLSIRVPLFVVGPAIPKGKKINEMVYLQDVMATTLEIAKIEKPKGIYFNSLLPLALGQADKSVYPVIYNGYIRAQRMVRTKDYKMIIYPKINVVRLYHLSEDKWELDDLAVQKNKYRDKLNELFQLLKEQQKELGDELDVSNAFDHFMKASQ